MHEATTDRDGHPDKNESLLARELPSLVYYALAIVVTLTVLIQTSGVLLERPQIEPDDYRFVARALELDAEVDRGMLASGVVENRWDMLPFVDVDGGVRFWRPLFPASFALDARASDGFAAPRGSTAQARFEPILLTNLVLHAVCCLLAFGVGARLTGRCIAALLGGALFACFAPHAEAIWYGAGRNATLLTSTFVGAWLLHTATITSDRSRMAIRVLAPLAFLAALCSKETALVFLVVVVVHDLVTRRGFDRVLYATYAGIAVVWFAGRLAALSGRDALPFVEPYVHMPWTADFWPHAWVATLGMLDAIGLATPLAPFLQPDEFANFNRVAGTVVGASVVGLVVLTGLRSRRGVAMIAFGVLTWLPTLPVYVSERYLYLPSIALCALVGETVRRGLPLWSTRANGSTERQADGGAGSWIHRGVRFVPWVFAALVVVHAYVHARTLEGKHRYISLQPRAGWGVAHALRNVRQDLENAGSMRLLVVDFPGDVVHAQFFEDQLRVECSNGALEVRVLNLLPASAGLAQKNSRLRVTRGKAAITLRGERRHVLEENGARLLFDLVARTPGTTRRTRDGSVSLRILEGDGSGADAIEYELAGGFENARVLRYIAPPQSRGFPPAALSPGARIAEGVFELQ